MPLPISMKFFKNFFTLKYRLYTKLRGGKLLYDLDIKYWWWPFWVDSWALYKKLHKLGLLSNSVFVCTTKESAERELKQFCTAYYTYLAINKTKKQKLKTGTINKGSVLDIAFMESL